jgi:hypothetical protein
MKRALPFIISLLFFSCISSAYSKIYYDGEDVILKLEPEKIETEGELVKANITVENIPPKDSLKAWDHGYSDYGHTDSYLLDGGLGGVQIYLNYSPEYLDAVGFNWSDLCKNAKSKEYEFKDGKFSLNIQFDEEVFEDRVVVGTLIFNPKKEGNTQLDFLNKNLNDTSVEDVTALTSAEGRRYNGHEEFVCIQVNGKKVQDHFVYPNTVFKGCEVIIKGTGEENVSKNLKDEFEVSSGGATNIINKVNVITNQKTPKVIVEEINVSEIEPNVSVVLNVDYDEGIDFKLLGMIFVVSLIGGAMFGFLGRGF